MQLKTIAVAGILSLALTACLEPVGQAKTKSSLDTEKDRFS